MTKNLRKNIEIPHNTDNCGVSVRKIKTLVFQLKIMYHKQDVFSTNYQL